jgi:hypothetical protein
VFTNAKGDSEALIIHVQDHQVYHVARESRSPTGWNLVGLGAELTWIAAVDAHTAWALGSDFGVWRIQNGLWTRIADLPNSIEPRGLSVDRGGNAWVAAIVSNAIALYQYQPQGEWQLAEGTAGLYPPKGYPGKLWSYNDIGDFYTNAWGTWQKGAPRLPSGGVMDLDVDLEGKVWAIDPNSVVYKLVAGGWEKIPGTPPNLKSIVGVSHDVLWGTVQSGDGSYVLYQFFDGRWQPAAGAPDLNGGDVISIGRAASVWLIDAQGYACRHAPGSSSFERQMMPSGMVNASLGLSIVEVAVGTEADGTQHAFFIDDSTGSSLLYMSAQSGDGTWSAPQPIFTQYDESVSCTNIAVSNQQSDNALIMSGVLPYGSGMVVVRWNDSAYVGTKYLVESAALGKSKMQISAIDPEHWWTFTLSGPALFAGFGTADNPLNSNLEGKLAYVGFNAYTAPQPPIAALVDIPVIGTENTAYACVLDTSGNLWMVTNVQQQGFDAEGNWQQLTNVPGVPPFAVGAAAGVAQADGSIRLYACENSSSGINRLWVSRQKGTSVGPNGFFEWTNWHPLGGDYVFLAHGRGSLANSELFAIARDAGLKHLVQTNGTGVWKASTVKHVQSGEPDYITQYKTEATLYDPNDRPESGVPITIASDEAVGLWINGKSYELEVGQTITAPTNGSGKLTVSTIAFGLHTPHLTFSADSLPPVPPVYGPQHVHDYLAGTGQLPDLSPMDKTNGPTTLQQAQVYTSRFPPVQQTLSPNLDGPTATAAVTAFNDGFSIPVSRSGPVAQPAGSIVRRSGEPDDVWDDFWNELQQFGTDVYHAIQNAAVKVYQVTVDVEQGIVNIGIAIEGVGQRVLSFIVKTYQDLANLAHAVFLMIEVAVEKAIDWLKALFDWHNIKNTQAVLEHYAGQAIPYFQGIIADGQKLLDGFFAKLESDVRTQFVALEQMPFIKGKTMNDLASGNYVTGLTPRSRRAAAAFEPSTLLHAVQPNWVLEKAFPVLSLSVLTGFPSEPGIQKPLQDFIARLQSAVNDFDAFFGDIQKWLVSAVTQPSDFKNVPVTDVLNTLRDLVIGCLEFADDMIQAFLDLVQVVLSIADNALKTAIDVPIVSSLYNKITGENLTFLGCFMLLAAMPVTVGYKAATGNALFTDDMVSYITAQTPPKPTGDTARATSAAKLPADVVKDIQDAVKYTAAGATALWALMDTCMDANPDLSFKALQMADILFPVGLQMLQWPSDIPLDPIPFHTKAEGFTFGTWLAGWAPPALNLGLLVATDAELKAQLLRYMDPFGKVLLTAIGGDTLALGVLASGFGGADGSLDGGQIAANVLGPMPNIFSFFRLDALEEVSEGILPVAKLLIDFFTGEGTAVAIGAS